NTIPNCANSLTASWSGCTRAACWSTSATAGFRCRSARTSEGRGAGFQFDVGGLEAHTPDQPATIIAADQRITLRRAGVDRRYLGAVAGGGCTPVGGVLDEAIGGAKPLYSYAVAGSIVHRSALQTF